MKPMTYVIVIACTGLIGGCASSAPPAELMTAREAYRHASANPEAQWVPEELHEAQKALAAAENSFQYAPRSYRTRDLAYIADRKARTAEALGGAASEKAPAIVANKNLLRTHGEIPKQVKDLVPATQRKIPGEANGLGGEGAKLAADPHPGLQRFATFKHEAWGFVVTITDSLLFALDKSNLLPAARDSLNQVARLLLATTSRRLTIEGHTDTWGSANDNQEMSQARADAVRSYLISRGYPMDQIQAYGIGDIHPVADNGSEEGRASNRRIEIIAERAAK